MLGQFPENPPEGDYRILWIGNPQVMPIPSWTLEPGIGYAITDDGPLTQYEIWPGRPSRTEAAVGAVVHQLASESTLRGGRLLAPYAIRFIVVPVADGATSTVDAPLPLPKGLVDALDDQLDFAAPLTRPLNFLVYENTAWIPTRAQFSAADADATRQAGLDSLAKLELRPLATPVAIGAGDDIDVDFSAGAGAVTVATGVDQRWSLSVGGQSIRPRPAFGSTTGYDIPAAGQAVLRYHTDTSRAFELVGQLLLWLLLALGVSRFDTASVTRWRRRRLDAAPEAPLLSIDAPIEVPIDHSVVVSMNDDPASWNAPELPEVEHADAASPASPHAEEQPVAEDPPLNPTSSSITPSSAMSTSTRQASNDGRSPARGRADGVGLDRRGRRPATLVARCTARPREFSRLGAPPCRSFRRDFVTSAWFCAGVPVGGPQLGGSAIIANPAEVTLTGRSRRTPMRPASRRSATAFEVPPRGTKVFDLAQMQPQGTYISSMVEIYGGGGFVEQRADSASGSAVSPCSNSTSSTWYFADGYTVEGSKEDLIITNPFPSDAIVSIREATATESRVPAIAAEPARSGQFGARRQPGSARQARIGAGDHRHEHPRQGVVGRAQEYLTSIGRAGFTMTLGAPSLGEQFYFADGEVAPNAIERYSIYNGSASEAVVNVAFLGLDPSLGFVNPEPITVPAGNVVSLIAGDVGVPPGRHGAVFSTETAGSILVERAITRTTQETSPRLWRHRSSWGRRRRSRQLGGAWPSAPICRSKMCSSSSTRQAWTAPSRSRRWVSGERCRCRGWRRFRCQRAA